MAASDCFCVGHVWNIDEKPNGGQSVGMVGAKTNRRCTFSKCAVKGGHFLCHLLLGDPMLTSLLDPQSAVSLLEFFPFCCSLQSGPTFCFIIIHLFAVQA